MYALSRKIVRNGRMFVSVAVFLDVYVTIMKKGTAGDRDCDGLCSVPRQEIICDPRGVIRPGKEGESISLIIMGREKSQTGMALVSFRVLSTAGLGRNRQRPGVLL